MPLTQQTSPAASSLFSSLIDVKLAVDVVAGLLKDSPDLQMYPLGIYEHLDEVAGAVRAMQRHVSLLM